MTLRSALPLSERLALLFGRKLEYSPPGSPAAGSQEARSQECGRAGGRFRFVEPLDGAEDGESFLAEEVDLRRVVVVRRPGTRDASRHARFLREARLRSKLDHPGVPPIHEIGVGEDGVPFVVEKQVRGRTLAALLVERRSTPASFPLARAAATLVRVAETLEFAHGRGIVHGGLTPERIWLGDFGETWTLGWGRADGGSAGADTRSDVLALGRCLSETIEAANERGAKELMAIAARATAAEPERRYPSAAHVAADLRAWLEGRVVSAYATGTIAELSKWARRNRGLAWALSCAGISVLASLGAIAWTRSRAAERATAERAILLRLGDVKRVADLRERASNLFPAREPKLGDMDSWLSEAQALVDRLPEHRETRDRLAAAATPGDDEAGWQIETLDSLKAEILALDSDDPFAGGIADVTRRREVARSIRKRTVEDEAAAWTAAIAAIRDEKTCPPYRGLVITPQEGLVPLGRDPKSGLYEFCHVESGDRPRRAADGSLVPREADGIVLVLLPGGRATLGAQRVDPAGRNFDGEARNAEGPVYEVDLEPFFAGKYEITRGQWERLTGSNPSSCPPVPDRPFTPLYPVENVGSYTAERTLAGVDLRMLREEEWEYACRGGSDLPWPDRTTPAELEGFANIADLSSSGVNPMIEPAFDDGFVRLSPVGSFSPNGFGLHDVAGNVWEFARQRAFDADPASPTAREPGGRGVQEGFSMRGGSFYDVAAAARSSVRRVVSGVWRDGNFGHRAGRDLEVRR